MSALSGYEKFEGLDPAEWCDKGYAIINIDQRGTWNSEGDFTFFSQQDHEDAYDVIEWLAEQSWCNGSKSESKPLSFG
jgi:putative CocE/NonD family hydrolase